MKEVLVTTHTSLYVLSSNRSVIDTLVDKLIFGVSRVEGHLHNALHLIIHVSVSAKLFAKAADRDFAKVGLDFDEQCHTP